MLKLFDEGYDVWLGNNSDVDESRYMGDDWEWAWKSNTWYNYGLADVHHEIDKILDQTGAEKVTYIGYSQGTA